MWLGLILFGILADKRGRRIVYLLSMLCVLVFGLISAFCQTYYGLLIARLLVGVGVGGASAVAVLRAIRSAPGSNLGPYELRGPPPPPPRCAVVPPTFPGAGVSFTMYSEFLPTEKRGMCVMLFLTTALHRMGRCSPMLMPGSHGAVTVAEDPRAAAT